MPSRWCNACGDSFVPIPQVPHQSYCGKPACTRERRRLWQSAKRSADPDYLSNQAQAQAAWSARNPGYWRAYRASHPDYTAANRAQQKTRNAKARSTDVAKKNERPPPAALVPGLYELRRLDLDEIAKIDVWIVQLAVLGHSPAHDPTVAKR